MPRKNQRRKNVSSQASRRKAKPIKFNPSEIESEQKLLNTSADADVDDVNGCDDDEDGNIDAALNAENAASSDMDCEIFNQTSDIGDTAEVNAVLSAPSTSSITHNLIGNADIDTDNRMFTNEF